LPTAARRASRTPAASSTTASTLPELRASRARHRSALVLRCIEDDAAGRRFPLGLVQADGTLFTPEVKTAST
jgi:hypothetical protein